jgi:hypothetical protein
MAPTYEQLEAMSDAEVKARYNELSTNASEGLEWYREELHWRTLRRHTEALGRLTWVIVALTAANVVLVAFTLLN